MHSVSFSENEGNFLWQKIVEIRETGIYPIVNLYFVCLTKKNRFWWPVFIPLDGPYLSRRNLFWKTIWVLDGFWLWFLNAILVGGLVFFPIFFLYFFFFIFFFFFSNIWDNPSHWLIFFSGVGQPPTRINARVLKLEQGSFGGAVETVKDLDWNVFSGGIGGKCTGYCVFLMGRTSL